MRFASTVSVQPSSKAVPPAPYVGIVSPSAGDYKTALALNAIGAWPLVYFVVPCPAQGHPDMCEYARQKNNSERKRSWQRRADILCLCRDMRSSEWPCALGPVPARIAAETGRAADNGIFKLVYRSESLQRSAEIVRDRWHMPLTSNRLQVKRSVARYRRSASAWAWWNRPKWAAYGFFAGEVKPNPALVPTSLAAAWNEASISHGWPVADGLRRSAC